MIKKSKTKKTSKNTNSGGDVTPDGDRSNFSLFGLDLGKRFYLLVNRLDLSDAILIYTLGCNGKSNLYEMRATEDVTTFSDSAKADIYYDTIKEVIKSNKNTDLYEIALFHNRDLVKEFEKHR